jgi:hypothetical protein
MDTTANTFTNRSNARRAAEAMIAKGTAPALDYGIKPRDDGRFEIVWKTGNAATAVSEADVALAEQNWSGPGLPTGGRTKACKAPRPRLFPLGCWSCMASGRGRPCSDRAFPCCSPLASAEEVGPFAGPSGEHPAASGRALLDSAVRPYPSPISGHGPSCHASRGGRARDGASGASPTLYRRPKAAARA